MIKLIHLALIIFSFTSYNSIAVTMDNNTKPYIHEYPFLSGGFNMKNYQSCRKLIANCPAKGAIHDCGNLLNNKPECTGLSKLSQAIGGQMPLIKIMQYGKVMLVSQEFLADGQDEYYLISSSNKLIDTNIDPLTLSPSLKQKYQKISLFPVHWGKPKIKLSKNKLQIFNFAMKAHDTCLACKIVMSYDLQFTFDANGVFSGVQLKNVKN